MTDLSKSQLNTVLGALDGQPRNPNSKDAARRAIGRHAERLGLSVADLLASAAGLLDGRISAKAFLLQLREASAGESVESHADEGRPEASRTEGDSPAAAKTAPEVKDKEGEPLASIDTPHATDQPVVTSDAQPSPAGARAPSVKQQLLATCQAAERWLRTPHDQPGEILGVLHAAIARAEGGQRQGREPKAPRQPRANSKEAQVIALLRRPQGVTLAQIGEHTGWQTHTIRGFFAGALRKRHGLQVTSEKTGDGERIYRIGGGCSPEHR